MHRILIATGLYPPDIGGPATYSKLLEEKLPKHGFSVRVLSFGEVRHLPKFLRHTFYFFKILKKSIGANIIYALDPVSVGLPAMCASKILKKRFILRIPGDYAWEQYSQKPKTKNQEFVTPEEFQNNKYDWVTEVRRKIEHYVAKHAFRIITPSIYLKNIVSKWGIDKKKIRVINSVVENIQEQGNKKELRRLMRFSGKLVISVGRLVPWKGFLLLVEIMPGLIKKFPNLKLLIIGSGPDAVSLERKINELNLKEHIVLTGSLSRDILLKYIRSADVFILNTGYEGLSHQILEVMAVGTPIITTNVGGNPEVIANEKNGILVPYNDREALEGSIERLLKNKTLANALSKQAKSDLTRFSVDKMIKSLIKELS